MKHPRAAAALVCVLAASAGASAKSFFEGRTLTCRTHDAGSGSHTGAYYRLAFDASGGVDMFVEREGFSCGDGLLGSFKIGEPGAYSYRCDGVAPTPEGFVERGDGVQTFTIEGRTLHAQDVRELKKGAGELLASYQVSFNVEIDCSDDGCEGAYLARLESGAEWRTRLVCDVEYETGS